MTTKGTRSVDDFDKKHYLSRTKQARDDIEVAEKLLLEVADHCRAGTQIHPVLGAYVADCLESAVAQPELCQSALNLRRPSSERREDILRNLAIFSQMSDLIERGETKKDAAKIVQAGLSLPITTRQIQNIYSKCKNNNKHEFMLKTKRRLEEEGKHS